MNESLYNVINADGSIMCENVTIREALLYLRLCKSPTVLRIQIASGAKAACAVCKMQPCICSYGTR